MARTVPEPAMRAVSLSLPRHGPPRDPHPRRRHRPRADRGDAPRARGDGRRVRLGRPGGRRRRDGAHGGTPLPEETLASIRDNGVAPQGADHDADRHRASARSTSRCATSSSLYACLRPCKTYPGVRSRYEDVDLVIVRENTEDLYAGIEFESGSDDAHAVIDDPRTAAAEADRREVRASRSSRISPEGSERIIRFAFEYARAQRAPRASRASRRRTS